MLELFDTLPAAILPGPFIALGALDDHPDDAQEETEHETEPGFVGKGPDPAQEETAPAPTLNLGRNRGARPLPGVVYSCRGNARTSDERGGLRWRWIRLRWGRDSGSLHRSLAVVTDLRRGIHLLSAFCTQHVASPHGVEFERHQRPERIAE